MGAWGVLAFDNDTAADWAFEIEHTDDMSLVESAFAGVDAVGDNYLDSDLASNALAACEILARLLGKPGYKNSYTEKVDLWVASHKLVPSSQLLTRANDVIDRILADKSELRDLWDESDHVIEWRGSVEDLRIRIRA